MDKRSEAACTGVHPSLCLVLREAYLGAQKFIVIHGLRTLGEEAAMVAGGMSQTLHSRHLPNINGMACAVDVAALHEGHVSWDGSLYRAINDQVQAASKRWDIPVEWGGDWKTLKDLGHFQLPWSKYP